MKLSTRLKGILVILGLLLLLTPASAQVTPQLSLYINWTPKEQLTTFNTDERYVTAQIYVNSNVQFWALDINCRIGTGAELTMDSIAFPQGTWGTITEDFFVNPDPEVLAPNNQILNRYNQAVGGGTLAFTVTRIGATTTPIGTNGVNYSLPIATVRFLVKNRATDAAVPTTCTTIRTLDRNGRQALVGTLGSFTNLFVRIGYTLQGTALRQGATNHLNVDVICTHVASGTPYGARTTATGTFRFGGATSTTQTANHLRQFGLYECKYRSNIIPESATVTDTGTQLYDNQFLEAVSYINLTTPKYQLMPVTLRAGDFDTNNTVQLADLNFITGAFNTPQTAFANGDANGDARINQNDLALVASNVDLTDAPDGLAADHTLYSLGTDYNPAFAFPNSRVQMGAPDSGAVARRNPASTTRDFWATLSPDGSEYAYVSLGTTGLYSLMLGNMTTGAGVPYRLPANFRYPHALAPSWSPDGSLVAWICTANPATEDFGILFNEGHLCYGNRGDIRGNSVIVLKNPNGTDINTEIFPPAWFSYPYQDGIGLALIYAENNTLKYYDFVSNTVGTIPDIAAGNSDMPVVINHWSGDSFLFYRFFDGTNYRLQVAVLHRNTSVDPSSPNGTYNATAAGLNFTFTDVNTDVFGSVGTENDPNAFHMIIDDTTNVRYYDVSPSLNIMMYADLNGYNIKNVYTDAAPDAIPNLVVDFWSSDNASEVHFVDGNIGSPTTSLFNEGELWGGVDSDPTLYHAQRVTFDWVP